MFTLKLILNFKVKFLTQISLHKLEEKYACRYIHNNRRMLALCSEET